MKRYILIFGAILLFGCAKEKPEELTFSYIRSYYDIDNLEFNGKVYCSETRGALPDYFYLAITVSNGDITGRYTSKSTGSNRDKFIELCEKNGDTGFRQGEPAERYTVFAYDFVSVSIKSDAAWDAEHPAGKELTDIFRIGFYSVLNIIERSYAWPWGEAVGGTITEMSPDSWRMLSNGGIKGAQLISLSCNLPWESEYPRTHNLTVKLTTDDGRTFEDTVQVSWE